MDAKGTGSNRGPHEDFETAEYAEYAEPDGMEERQQAARSPDASRGWGAIDVARPSVESGGKVEPRKTPNTRKMREEVESRNTLNTRK